MEVITVLGIVCLLLIIVSSMGKRKRAEQLASSIDRMKQTIKSDDQRAENLWEQFPREFAEIELAVGRIESKAILDYPIVKEFVRLLPAECYEASSDRRRQLIASAMTTHWAPQLSPASPQTFGRYAAASVFSPEAIGILKPISNQGTPLRARSVEKPIYSKLSPVVKIIPKSGSPESDTEFHGPRVGAELSEDREGTMSEHVNLLREVSTQSERIVNV